MPNSSQCTSKRKRGEQSAEEPAAVRRSTRQKAKGQESVIERAMNRKMINSLELNSSRAAQTLQKGIRSSSETGTRKVSQSNMAGSNHTTIQASQSGSSIVTISGRRTSTNYTRHLSVRGSPDLVNLNSQRTYSPSSPTIPQIPSVAPRVTNPSFQNFPPHSGLDKGTELSLSPSTPTMNALKVPAQGVDYVILLETSEVFIYNVGDDDIPLLIGGIRSLSSTAGHQCRADNSRLSSAKIYAGRTTKPIPVRENKVLRRNNVAENRHHSENDDAKITNLNQKSVLPSSQQKPTYYIKRAGSSHILTSPPALLPLGERCHLCGIDLAFEGKGSDSQTEDPPFVAVLPCRLSCHDHCITNVFGAGEPPVCDVWRMNHHKEAKNL